jgi:hypothetical protein
VIGFAFLRAGLAADGLSGRAPAAWPPPTGRTLGMTISLHVERA